MVQFLLKHFLKTEDSCCVPLFPLIAGCYKMLTDKLPSRTVKESVWSQKFWKGRPFYLLSPIAMSKWGANGGLWVICCSLNRNRRSSFDCDLITPSLHERNTSTTELGSLNTFDSTYSMKPYISSFTNSPLGCYMSRKPWVLLNRWRTGHWFNANLCSRGSSTWGTFAYPKGYI